MTKKTAEYNAAYVALVESFLDPGKRAVADANPLIRDIMAKITDTDLNYLSRIINNQKISVHGDPFNGTRNDAG